MKIKNIVEYNQPDEYRKLGKYKIPKFMLHLEKLLDKIVDPLLERMLAK